MICMDQASSKSCVQCQGHVAWQQCQAVRSCSAFIDTSCVLYTYSFIYLFTFVFIYVCVCIREHAIIPDLVPIAAASTLTAT